MVHPAGGAGEVVVGRGRVAATFATVGLAVAVAVFRAGRRLEGAHNGELEGSGGVVLKNVVTRLIGACNGVHDVGYSGRVRALFHRPAISEAGTLCRRHAQLEGERITVHGADNLCDGLLRLTVVSQHSGTPLNVHRKRSHRESAVLVADLVVAARQAGGYDSIAANLVEPLVIAGIGQHAAEYALILAAHEARIRHGVRKRRRIVAVGQRLPSSRYLKSSLLDGNLNTRAAIVAQLVVPGVTANKGRRDEEVGARVFRLGYLRARAALTKQVSIKRHVHVIAFHEASMVGEEVVPHEGDGLSIVDLAIFLSSGEAEHHGRYLPLHGVNAVFELVVDVGVGARKRDYRLVLARVRRRVHHFGVRPVGALRIVRVHRFHLAGIGSHDALHANLRDLLLAVVHQGRGIRAHRHLRFVDSPFKLEAAGEVAARRMVARLHRSRIRSRVRCLGGIHGLFEHERTIIHINPAADREAGVLVGRVRIGDLEREGPRHVPVFDRQLVVIVPVQVEDVLDPVVHGLVIVRVEHHARDVDGLDGVGRGGLVGIPARARDGDGNLARVHGVAEGERVVLALHGGLTANLNRDLRLLLRAVVGVLGPRELDGGVSDVQRRVGAQVQGVGKRLRVEHDFTRTGVLSRRVDGESIRLSAGAS